MVVGKKERRRVEKFRFGDEDEADGEERNGWIFSGGTSTRSSPVNIVATATVVTDEALLGDDEVDNCEGESEGTEKSTQEEDEEVDVDVEECSSVDEGPIHDAVSASAAAAAAAKCQQDGGAHGNSDERRAHRLRTSCNSDELRDVECHLETKELWDKFNDLGTEMIITKTGR